MHICCTNMLRMEEYRLPKLFMVSGYTVYFWSNENGEPICNRQDKILLLKDTAIVYRENISVPCRCFVL